MALDSSTLIPISNALDTSLIKEMDPKSPEFKRFIISLVDNVNSILLAVNAKSIGKYGDKESLSGNSYYNEDKQVEDPSYNVVINCGALPDTATKQIAHGLDSTWSYKLVRIIGASSDSTNKKYLPIPYATSTAIDIIEMWIDDTYINITTGKDRTSFDTTKIILEYLEI